jgi:subtilisin family serine protease
MASLPTRLTSSIAGVAPGVLYLPIAYQGDASLDHAYSYLVAMRRAGVPIRVANLSFGNAKPHPSQCSPRTKNDKALTPLGELLSSDISIVAAAGNEGINNDIHFVCPAGHAKNYDSVISVGAVDPQGHLPFYSNFGNSSVTTSAPGSAVFMGYGYQTGTSIATALVSGIVALMYTANPDLTPSEVKRVIIETTKMPELNLPTRSKGIISATNAVKAVWIGPQPESKKKPPL